jgi:hypothetical protein
MGLFDGVGQILGQLTTEAQNDRAISQNTLFNLIQANPSLIQDPAVAKQAQSVFARNPEILSALQALEPAQKKAANDAFLRQLDQGQVIADKEDQRNLLNQIASLPDFPGKDAALKALGNPDLPPEDRAQIQAVIAEAQGTQAQAQAVEAGAAEQAQELDTFESKERIKAGLRDDKPDTISQLLGAMGAQQEALLGFASDAISAGQKLTEKPTDTAASKEAARAAVELKTEQAVTDFVSQMLPFTIMQDQLAQGGALAEVTMGLLGKRDMSIADIQQAVANGELVEEFGIARDLATRRFNMGKEGGRAAALQRIVSHPELGPELLRRKDELAGEMVLQSQERQTEIVSPARTEATQGILNATSRDANGNPILDISGAVSQASRQAFGEQIEPVAPILPIDEAQSVGGLPTPTVYAEDIPLDLAAEISAFPERHQPIVLQLFQAYGTDWDSVRKELDILKRLYGEEVIKAQQGQ